MIKEGVICHAEGPRCLGCDHYHGRSSVCAYAPASDQPAPTPRTDALYDDLERQAESGALRHNDVRIRKEEHARQLERELSDARAEADRLREAMRPKIMPSVGVAIGTRLRDFYRNRFALVNPVQHTDNERQVILAALESLLSALAATRKDSSNG